MNVQIRKVAVLGSGVMGSAIAAHFANAGIPSLVLDIVPPDAGPESGRKARNAIVDGAVKAMLKARPSPLFTKERLGLIDTGNFEDDLPRIADADWVIEVVKEDPAIKAKVLEAAAPHMGEDAWLSSNTSGLSLANMAAVLPDSLRPRFLGTHFFNPPRYMKLLELIPTARHRPRADGRPGRVRLRDPGQGHRAGRGHAQFHRQPGGVHAMMVTMKVMDEMGLTIEEIDALTGPALGRPKTATYKLADLVGLDTFLHVAENVYEAAADDEARDVFIPPAFLKAWSKRGCWAARPAAASTACRRTPRARNRC